MVTPPREQRAAVRGSDVTHRILLEVDEGAGCDLSDEDEQEAGEVLRRDDRRQVKHKHRPSSLFPRHFDSFLCCFMLIPDSDFILKESEGKQTSFSHVWYKSSTVLQPATRGPRRHFKGALVTGNWSLIVTKCLFSFV